MWQPIRAQPKRTDMVVMRGGLDIATPAQQIDPGKVTTAQNYEVALGNGYRRILGIERYDGRPRPSDAKYDMIWGPFTGIAVGNTVNGQTSGATAVVIDLHPNASSIQAVIVTKRSGAFQVGETLRVGTVPKGTITNFPSTFQMDPFKDLDWRYLAAEEYRKDIQRPPGSGPVRGVFSIGGVLYCVRNNVSATQAIMYRATSSGWQQVNLGFSLRYQNGNTGVPISVGQTVVGATSGATGVVQKVTVEAGSDAFSSGNPASGQLIFLSITGTFQAGEALNVSGVRRADAVAAQEANTLPVDGRYEAVEHNFYGNTASRALYVANGVSRAFEFNGTVFCFINSGLSAPVHVAVHGSSLVLAQGAEIAISRPGYPTSFDGTLGAVSVAVGGDVTGMIRVPGSTENNATVIATKQAGVLVLYGSDASNYQIAAASPERSIARYSLAAVGTPIGLDRSGLTQVLQTSAFGNFAFSSFSAEYNRLLIALYNGVTASCTVPSKGLYRIFFSNGGGIAVTMVGTKPIGAIPFDYRGRTAFCAYLSDIDNESVFIGSTDGFVYQLDKGTSIDGQPIISWLKTAPNFSGSFASRKRYFDARFEITPSSAFKLTVVPKFSLERGDNAEHQPFEASSFGSGSYWDDAFWDQFYWDASGFSNFGIDLNGSGSCINFLLYNESSKYLPWTVESYSIRYVARREER